MGSQAGTRPIGRQTHGGSRGFTLIELIVVMSVISVLAGILLPVVHTVKRKAELLVSMANQKSMANAVDLFAADHRERYPDSVAKVGFGQLWNWSDPTKLAGSDLRTPAPFRSVSSYLGTYLDKPDTLYCPCSPRRYTYLDEAWDAGDDWDNPETPVFPDVVGGTYCLYWNYVGYLGEDLPLFQGPRGPADGRTTSNVLLTDYLGYDHWRAPGQYISCEPLEKAEVVPETLLLSALWSCKKDPIVDPPQVQLNAAFTDGHVEHFSSQDTIPMRVIKDRATATPYELTEPGPGIYFLPTAAVQP